MTDKPAETETSAAPTQPMPEPIMEHFAFAHLPPQLQAASRPFGELADFMVRTLPRCAERTAGLRKLLEAKDCAVRAARSTSVPPTASK